MNFVLFLICGLVVNDAPPTGLLKGYMFLLVLDETSFLGCTSGSIRRNSGQVSSHAGVSKGGEPPLCRRGGGVHRGGTPSKGSRPYAPFCLLFRRGKSRSGCRAEGPTGIHRFTAPPGTAPESPGTRPHSSVPRRRPPWAGGWRGSSPAGC